MKPIQLEIKTYEELKEELGNEYDTAMYEINISALKEIERLNNIINEFGIWLLERKEFYKTKTGVENNIAFSFSKVAFDKLQELKGDGSNEKTNS